MLSKGKVTQYLDATCAGAEIEIKAAVEALLHKLVVPRHEAEAGEPWRTVTSACHTKQQKGSRTSVGGSSSRGRPRALASIVRLLLPWAGTLGAT